MKTLRDDDGKRYLLVKRSGDASLVRDPETGNACYVSNDRLEPVEGESPLETAAGGVSAPVRRLIRGVHDDRTLGLLLVLADRGPLGVRTLLDVDALCESDLHGTLAELTAAGLIAETTVDGERGYRVTDDCRRALERLRGPLESDGSEDEDGDADSTGENEDADTTDTGGEESDGAADIDTDTDRTDTDHTDD